MSYLEGYGVKDARLEKLKRRVLLGALVVIIVAVAGYLKFRNFREERLIQAFLDNLRRQDYKAAYAQWGCTDSRPCPHYAFDKFMEDWGPQSQQIDMASMKLGKLRSCDTGVIQVLEFTAKPPVKIRVDRQEQAIAFSPWWSCNPKDEISVR